MLIPTTAPDRCAMKLGWGPEEGSGGEKRSQTARPTSELTVEDRGRDRINVEESLQAPAPDWTRRKKELLNMLTNLLNLLSGRELNDKIDVAVSTINMQATASRQLAQQKAWKQQR